MESKAKISESRLRQIILEELLEHYLVQKELWDDEKRSTKVDPPVNKSGKTA